VEEISEEIPRISSNDVKREMRKMISRKARIHRMAIRLKQNYQALQDYKRLGNQMLVATTEDEIKAFENYLIEKLDASIVVEEIRKQFANEDWEE